jgi:hypothetical protein
MASDFIVARLFYQREQLFFIWKYAKSLFDVFVELQAE